MSYILVLDGYNGYVNVPDNSPDHKLSFQNAIQGWTMSALIRPDAPLAPGGVGYDFPSTDATSEGPAIAFLAKIDTSAGREYEMLLFNYSNSVRQNANYDYFYDAKSDNSLGAGTYFQHFGMSSGDSGYDPTPWKSGEWMNITFTIGSKNEIVYKNGVKMRCDDYILYDPNPSDPNCIINDYVNTPQIYQGNYGSSPLRIGLWYPCSGTGLFMGAYRDVRIFKRLLSDSEVSTLNSDMNNGTNTIDPSFTDLVLWHNYRLGNANDQSGHGFNGILMNNSTCQSVTPGDNSARFVTDSGCNPPTCLLVVGG